MKTIKISVPFPVPIPRLRLPGRQQLFKAKYLFKKGLRLVSSVSADRIRIIVTGGTFDKHYDEIQGKFTFYDTHLPDILKDGRCRLPITIELYQMIDSLNMTHMDRIKILDICQQAPERYLIITHGTDTMVETAVLLGRAGMDKTIVMTGAMIPYLMRHSDAPFNLAGSIIAVQTLPAGVYICMNGAIFNWDNVRKNRLKGIFENLKK